MAFPEDYKDTLYASLDSSNEQKYKLPVGLVSSIRESGEKTNASQVSSAKAKTPYQFIPSTRNSILKQHGIDVWLSPENASEGAAILLSDSLKRNNGDVESAVREYHGGTNKENWGKVNDAYWSRVSQGLQSKKLDSLSSGFSDWLKANPATPETAPQQAAQTNTIDKLSKGFGEWLKNPSDVEPNGETLLANTIPGQRALPPAKEPESSLLDKAIGTGEAALSTATGATTGTLGQAGGALGGLAASILDGSFGTPQATQMIEQAATQGATDLTYQPSTLEGQKQTAAVGDVLSQVTPAIPLTNELASLGRGTQALKQSIKPVVTNVVDNIKASNPLVKAGKVAPDSSGLGSVGSAATNPIEQARASVASASPEIKSVVEQGIKQGGEINQAAIDRHVEADTLPVPVRLTKGQALEDPILISEEKNARGKNQELATHFNEQNKALSENLPAIREQASPDVYGMDIPEHGDALIASYKSLDNELKAQIRAKYKALEDANGGNFPIDATTFVDNADAALIKKRQSRFVPSAIKGIMDEYKDSNKMNFNDFEELRTILDRESRKAKRAGDGNVVGAISTVRNSLEDIPMTNESANIKPIADSARQAAKARFDLLKADPAYGDVVDGSVSPDKFIQKYLIGSDVNKVQTLAKNLSFDAQAKQVMASGVIKWLEKQAGLVDGGGSFSQARYNKALEQIRPKLDIIFQPAQVKQIETLGKVARYVQNQPAGSYVNNSNTTVAAAANHAKSAAEGAANFAAHGIPVGTVIRNAIERKAAEKAIKETLAPGAGIVTKKKAK